MSPHGINLKLVLLTILLSALVFGNRAVTTSDRLLDEFVPFDTYFNNEPLKTRWKRLNLLAEMLVDSRDKTAYIVSYGTIKSADCESLENLKVIRRYLVETKRVNPARIVLLDGGYRSKGMTELYLVPKDATFPEPRPKYRLNDVLNGVP